MNTHRIVKNSLALLLSCLAFSSISAQAVDKRQIIIDAYYGGPQIFAFLPSTKSNVEGGQLNLKFVGFGPLGVRGEYMFTKRSSVGLDLTYVHSELDVFWTNGNDSFKGTAALDRFRFLPRYAVHFGGKKLDAFFHVGLGVVYGRLEANTSDSSNTFQYSDISNIDIPFLNLNKPSAAFVTFRTGLGFRYFFTPNIGLNADFGIGGALVSGGITGKF